MLCEFIVILWLDAEKLRWTDTLFPGWIKVGSSFPWFGVDLGFVVLNWETEFDLATWMKGCCDGGETTDVAPGPQVSSFASFVAVLSCISVLCDFWESDVCILIEEIKKFGMSTLVVTNLVVLNKPGDGLSVWEAKPLGGYQMWGGQFRYDASAVCVLVSLVVSERAIPMQYSFVLIVNMSTYSDWVQ